MKTININTQENLKFLLFPDNQPHVNVLNVSEGDDVDVVCSITDSLKLLQLLQTANALDNLFAHKRDLYIPYLMGARYDRPMQSGDSVDLKVIAGLINGIEFERVYLYDVHSDVASMLINNSVNISNEALVAKYDRPNSVLICPDSGAAKKIEKYLKWNNNLVEVVYCIKNRDAQGKISLNVLNAEKCKDRHCVIIDDLCDGGGTFLAIANQISPYYLSLIVTHGIFSKGIKCLEEKFDEIIVSDSYCRSYDSRVVKMHNWIYG